MNILVLTNAKKWSWSFQIKQMRELIHHRFVNILTIPGVEVDQELTEFFDVVLIQNIDRLKHVTPNKNQIVRFGGMFTGNNYLKEFMSKYAERLSRVGYVISTNKELYKIASKFCKNISIIPNGVDLELFKPLPRNKNKKFTFGFAGNISGQGRDYKGWNLYADVRNSMFYCTDELVFLFHHKQIPYETMPVKFYNNIDCLILPSINEGCSNVVCEALACGVPVLCTKVGYHGENLTHGKNVLFIKRNVTDIENKINLLMSDEKLRQRLSLEGRKFAEQHHNIIDVAKMYDKIIDNIEES